MRDSDNGAGHKRLKKSNSTDDAEQGLEDALIQSSSSKTPDLDSEIIDRNSVDYVRKEIELEFQTSSASEEW